MVDLPDAPTRREILEVTLAANRLGPDVNLTRIAEQLEGYSGSDIKEVCREAVVRVAHERASQLEAGGAVAAAGGGGGGEEEGEGEGDISDLHTLRAVSSRDFSVAMRKLQASVDDSGREMQKVQEWNSKYGESRRGRGGRAKTGGLSMYI